MTIKPRGESVDRCQQPKTKQKREQCGRGRVFRSLPRFNTKHLECESPVSVEWARQEILKSTRTSLEHGEKADGAVAQYQLTVYLSNCRKLTLFGLRRRAGRRHLRSAHVQRAFYFLVPSKSHSHRTQEPQN